jgi:hypothetical protein
VTFVENILNDPIPVSQFSFEALGYYDGEQVTDQRPENPSIYYKSQSFESNLAQELRALPPRAVYEELPPEFAESLSGKVLPELTDIGINIVPEQIIGRIILVCFFDINQRPSRNCLLQLTKWAQEVKAKDVALVTVQASRIDPNTLNEWVKKNNIPFAVGMIEGEPEKIRFIWGVKSLPWLILTDKKHIVQAEGFPFSELDEKIKDNVPSANTIADSDKVTGLVKDPQGQLLSNVRSRRTKNM